MSHETSRLRQVHSLRAEFERLEGRRLSLAARRTDAWCSRDLSEAGRLTDELETIYERWRSARAGLKAGGRPGPITALSTTHASITTVPELVADPVAVFVRERCRLRSGALTQTTDLKSAYGQWAATAGAEPMSPHAITKRLLRMPGICTYRSHGRRLYRGIEIRHHNAQPEGDTFGEARKHVRTLETR